MGLDIRKVSFRRLRREHLPQLYDWITKEPPTNRFWGYVQGHTYGQFLQEFTASIKGKDSTKPYIIYYEEKPIGYIQTYHWNDYPGCEKYEELQKAAGLDVLVGAKSYRNKGLGSKVLQKFLKEIIFTDPKIQFCVTDPDIRNTVAIRAYEKTGFHKTRQVDEVLDEPRPVVLMRISRKEVI